MLRLAEPDGEHCWLLPQPPDDVAPSVLREMRVAMLPVHQPNETGRVLAAALRCCWADVEVAIWPGQPSNAREVLDVVDQLMPGRDAKALHRMGTSALRRLHTSGWLRFDEDTGQVRLGPRVATWPDQDLPALKDLRRELPGPRFSREPEA